MSHAPVTPCRSLVVTATDNYACAQGHLLVFKACPCDDYQPGLNAAERTRCEVWSRVMGYHRPVSAWNAGKQSEHRERVNFREPADA